MRSVTLGSVASILVFMLALGALITGCGGNGDEGADNAPDAAPQPTEEAVSTDGAPENVFVRISGEEGAVYVGTVGSLGGETQSVEGIFETEPVEYEVKGLDPGFDAVQASIVNPAQASGGLFKVQIVADGEVVAERQTSVQYGAVNVSWSYQSQ